MSMMFGIFPATFRFRGKVRRLFDIYTCFLEHPGVGLHPTQISRYTGIAFVEVVARLDTTPELFVKLPKRDGITRYRLTTATSAREPEDVQKLLQSGARRESMLLWAITAMILCVLVMVMILIGPTL